MKDGRAAGVRLSRPTGTLNQCFSIGLQTGSVQVTALKEGERAGGAATRPGRPRGLVLGPTRELADQLLRVTKSLAHHEKFRSACVSGGTLSRQRCPGILQMKTGAACRHLLQTTARQSRDSAP